MWRLERSRRVRRSRSGGARSSRRGGSVGTRRAALTVRKHCLMPLGPGAPSATYDSLVPSCEGGGATRLSAAAGGRSSSSPRAPPSSPPALGFGGGLAISRTFLTRLPYIAVWVARVVAASAPRWRSLVAMAENISVTLTVWKPFFVFVSHGCGRLPGSYYQFPVECFSCSTHDAFIRVKKVEKLRKTIEKRTFPKKYVALDIEMSK